MSSRAGVKTLRTIVALPIVAVLVLCMLLLTPAAQGQDNSGITVAGTAKVMGKPTTVEIPCIVSGDAELTADAIVKYRDARKHTVASIEALKVPGLTVESNGYSVRDFVDAAAQQMAMQRGQAVVNTKQKVSVTEQLRIVVKDVDKMEPTALMDTMLKVLDTARDSGLTLGDGTPRNYNYYPQPAAPSLINFKIVDSGSMRDSAYKQAIEDAKSKAQKLADISGVKLGKILSVRDSNAKPVTPTPQGDQPTAPAQAELTSNVFSDIPMTIGLTVQFEIVK